MPRASAARDGKMAAKAPCRFFQIGQCNQGANCRFSHEIDGPIAKSKTRCVFFFERGRCVHGDKCAFSHEKPSAAEREGDAPRAPAPPIAVPKPSMQQPAPPNAPPPPPAPPVEVLMQMDAATRKQALGHCVYPRAHLIVGERLAGKITGMLLAMEPARLHWLLDKPADFLGAVRACLDVLPPEMLESLSASAGPRAPLASDPASDAALQTVIPTAAEVYASSQATCGVCLEPIVSKRGRFGLLEGCEHAFCVECIRQWRSTHAIRPDVARACPVCRAPSHFVVPSAVHFVGPRKAALTTAYLSRLRQIPCRHFDFGEGRCPFGSSCFYAHTDKLGREVRVEPRVALGKSGTTVLPSYRLSDFLFPDAEESRVLSDTDALLATIPLAPQNDETAIELQP